MQQHSVRQATANQPRTVDAKRRSQSTADWANQPAARQDLSAARMKQHPATQQGMFSAFSVFIDRSLEDPGFL
ncbi:hypothetical protein CPC08DRAFT_702693 [Agrocybe pediades]|nr:hypothetical protein CPC08DRAFT_702693 [Agrocybe pediades]